MSVYHIRYKKDHDNIDTGYIGITNNPVRRQAEHWSALTLQSHKNHKLQKAFDEHSDDLEFIIYKDFSDRKSAELLEETLRPYKNIGWNIAVGGSREFDERFQPKKFNIDNQYIDQEIFENNFLVVNKKFTTLELITRKALKPLVNNWRKSKQAVILSNLFQVFNLESSANTQSVGFIQHAWAIKSNIFQGDWGAIPHDLTSVGFAISIQLQSINIDFDEKLKCSLMLGNILEQIIVNGRLYQFNQVDVVLIGLIFESYFTFNIELKNNLK